MLKKKRIAVKQSYRSNGISKKQKQKIKGFCVVYTLKFAILSGGGNRQKEYMKVANLLQMV